MTKINKNRFIRLFLAVMLVITMLPVMGRIVYAEDGSGTKDDPWLIGDPEESDVQAWLTGGGNNKVLHISGTGQMKDFDNTYSGPWSSMSSEIASIVMELDSTVTSVGDNAFWHLKNVTKAVLSSSIKSIGDSSFFGCEKLTTVTFREQPEGWEVEIEDSAFKKGQKINYGIENLRLYDEGAVVEEGDDLYDYNGRTLVWKKHYYPLWVGGIHVSEANKKNILDDSGATASYDPDTNTLTLNGANIATGYSGIAGIYYNGTDDLIINLKDETHNSVGNDDLYYGIYSDKKEAKLYISGTGKLDVITYNTGIYVSGEIEVEDSTINTNGINSENNITFKSGTVTAISSGFYGIFSNNKAGLIMIYEDVKLTASGSEKAINGNVINWVQGTGWSDTKGTKDKTTIEIALTSTGLDFKKVQFPASNEYPLWIDNIRVSDSNKDNILDDSIASASYDPDTNTLTLNGVRINITDNRHGINYAGQDALKIKLVPGSDNEIKTEISTGTGCGIYSESADISVEGSGTLTIDQARGFAIRTDNDKNITIIGGTIDVKSGNGGILSGGDLLISDATVFAQQTWTYDFSLAAIRGKSVDIKNSSVTAVASAGKGVGIRGNSGVIIDNESPLTAIGKGQAIEGQVKNMIDGTGWTNIDGTQGQTKINISSEGQDLSSYKKVQFPDVTSDDTDDDIDDDTNTSPSAYSPPKTGVE